jgi:hypothetical protein
VLACSLLAEFLESNYLVGMGVGALSLLADAGSSALKRRLKKPPGTEIAALDQLPESFLPLATFASPLAMGWGEIVTASGLFMALDLLLTRLRHPAK